MYRSNSPEKKKWLIKTKVCENLRKKLDREKKNSFQKEKKIGKMYEGYRRARFLSEIKTEMRGNKADYY